MNKIKKDIESIKIGVIGAGSWGTALANLLGLKGFKINHWVFEKQVKQQIEYKRENQIFLPGVELSENIYPSNDLEQVVSDKDLLLFVVPSHLMREISLKISASISQNTVVVSASKGIENSTYLTMSGVLYETVHHIPKKNMAVLSGPSFAKEVATQVPTAISAASCDKETADFVQNIFATTFFRVYTSDDIIGVELGGAVKNVIAIASGIIDGLGLGLNSRAALITRGLAEIRRLGMSLGANPHTFSGLSGVGDLILTCTGDLSRNHTVGKKIGQGQKLKDILNEMRMVAEGVKTAQSLFNLSKKLDVELPICEEVYHILYDDFSPKDSVQRLMSRDLKQELDV